MGSDDVLLPNITHTTSRRRKSNDEVQPAPQTTTKQSGASYKWKVKRKQPNSTDDALDGEIIRLLDDRKRQRDDLLRVESTSTSTTNDLFFQSCAKRVNKLPSATQGYVQMIVSQILYRVETAALPNPGNIAGPLAYQPPTQFIAPYNVAGPSGTQNFDTPVTCSAPAAFNGSEDDILTTAMNTII